MSQPLGVPASGIQFGAGITVGAGVGLGNTVSGFTITSSDILGGGQPIWQNTVPIGTNGVDGFENTAPDNLGEGYYVYNFASALVTTMTDYVTAQGINPTNTQGYVYNVTWGAGSSIVSGLVKIGFYNGSGDPTQSYIYIQTIDPNDPSWQTNNSGYGTSLTGTFLFPATFSIYSPLTDKNYWC